MALINAQPLEGAPGWTLLTTDDGRELPVEDPTGEFLRRGLESISSPGAMRGSGALGADTRLAQNDPSPEEAASFAAQPRSNPLMPAGDHLPAEPAAEDPFALPSAGPSPSSAPATPSTESAEESGPQFVTIPGSKGGWRETLRSTVGMDMSPETIRALEERLAPEFDSYSQAIDATDKARRGQNSARQERFGNESIDAKLKVQALTDARAKAEGDATKAAHDVRRWTEEKVDPGQLWGNVGFAISAAIGGFAATLLDIKNQRRGGRGGAAGSFWNDIWGMVQSNINEQNRSIAVNLNEAKERFGSAEAGRAALEGKIAKAIADGATAQQKLAETQEEALGYDALRQLALAQQKTSMREAVTQYLPKVTSQSQNVPGSGPRLVPIEQAQLKALGLSNEDFTKAMTAKAGAGENAPTNADAIERIKSIRADVRTLQALSKDGVLTADKIVWNRLSDASRRGLSALGIDVDSSGAVDREKIRLIVGERLNEYARSFGGAITDSDRETAKQTMGSTLEAQVQFLGRIANRAEQSVKASLNAQRLGLAEPLLRLQLGAVSRTGGVPNPRVEVY